jgi:cell shape-determining protein MreC
MTYLSDKAKKRKNRVRYSIGAVFFVLVLVFWSYIRSFIAPALEPALMFYGEKKQTVASFPDFFKKYTASNAKLLQNTKDLEIQIERLENELAERDGELRILRDLFIDDSNEQATTSKKLTPVITMYPLMQDVTKLYSTILLSKGFKDGVTVDSYVHIRGKQAVCVIKEVYTGTSLCSLLTASGVSTEAVTSSSSITLTLVGRGGSFVANVARDTPISIGEKVFLKSDQSVILGEVSDVSNNNQDTSWHVFIHGAYNPVTSSIFYMDSK